MTHAELVQKYADLLQQHQSLLLVLDEQRARSTSTSDVTATIREAERRRADIQIETWRNSNADLLRALNAERASHLTAKSSLETALRERRKLEDRLERAGEKFNRVLKALRYYAEESNYREGWRATSLRLPTAPRLVSVDRGTLAREVLASIKGDEGV